MFGDRRRVEGEQRHHSGDGGRLGALQRPAEQGGHVGALHSRSLDLGHDDFGAAGAQRRHTALHRLVAGGPGQCHDEPGAGQRPGVGLGDRGPGHAVAPVRGDRAVPLPAPPRRQRRQDLTERTGAVDRQCVGDLRQVAVLDGRPQARLGRCARAVPERGRRRRGLSRPGLCPVTLVLEGVGGQFDPVRGRQQCGPVHGRPVDERPRQTGQQTAHALLVTFLAPLQRDEHTFVAAGSGDRVRAQSGQRTVRTDLDEHRHAFGGQRRQRVGEPHRLPRLRRPVPTLALTDQLTGQRARPQHLRARVRQLRCHRVEFVQYGIHGRRVERMADPQPPHPTALLTPVLHQPVHGGDLAGDHHGLRSVDRRDRHVRGQPRLHLGLRGTDRRHRPAAGQRLHQACTSRDQLARVGQRQHPGDIRGRHFSHRMPHDGVRHHTCRLQHGREADLEGEQTRLRIQRLMRKILIDAVRAQDHVPHRHTEFQLDQTAHPVEGLGKHRTALVQPPAHPRPLRTLTREDQSHTRSPQRDP